MPPAPVVPVTAPAPRSLAPAPFEPIPAPPNEPCPVFAWRPPPGPSPFDADPNDPTPRWKRQLPLMMAFATTLVINIALPILIYNLLRKHTDLSQGVCLLMQGVPSLLHSIYLGFVHGFRLDFFAVINVVSVVWQLVCLYIIHNDRLMLVSQSVSTFCIGIGYFASLWAGRMWPHKDIRPLSFHVGMQFACGGDAEKELFWAWLYECVPDFRRMQRVSSAVWGGAFIAEFILKVALVFALSVDTMSWLSYVLFGVMIVGVIRWQLEYSKRGKERGRKLREERMAKAALQQQWNEQAEMPPAAPRSTGSVHAQGQGDGYALLAPNGDAQA